MTLIIINIFKSPKLKIFSVINIGLDIASGSNCWYFTINYDLILKSIVNEISSSTIFIGLLLAIVSDSIVMQLESNGMSCIISSFTGHL